MWNVIIGIILGGAADTVTVTPPPPNKPIVTYQTIASAPSPYQYQRNHYGE